MNGTVVRSASASPCNGDDQTTIGINETTHSVSESTQAAFEEDISSTTLATIFMNIVNTSSEYEAEDRRAFGKATHSGVDAFINTLTSNDVSDTQITTMEDALVCGNVEDSITLNDFAEQHHTANQYDSDDEKLTEIADSSDQILEALIIAGASAEISEDTIQLAIEAALTSMNTIIIAHARKQR